MSLQPGTVVDRYVIESVLGRGGMAEVYAVRHRQLGSVHALKILTTPSSDVRSRLLQEGRVQAQLRHPNIVSVTDVVDVTGAPGLVMEYISGPTLAALSEVTRFPTALLDRLARGIINGIRAAHEHGLVHRDLKPANILLDISDGNLIPKVADFGLVKIVSGDEASNQEMTRSGVAMGTPSFMAPEQIRDTKTVDHRADLFSLGAILYELASGKRAFPGEDMMEIFTAIVGGDFAPLDKVAPDIPQRMIDAIHWALQVDLDERVPTCKALLDTWSEGNPHAFSWTTGEMRWPTNIVSLAVNHGHTPIVIEYSQLEESPALTWSGDEHDAGPAAGMLAAGGQMSQTAHDQSTAPHPPFPVASAAETIAAQLPPDGTLEPDNPAPNLDAARPPKMSVSGPFLGLTVLALVGAGGWWWNAQQMQNTVPTSGVQFPATPPARQVTEPSVPASGTVTPPEVLPRPSEAQDNDVVPAASSASAAPEPPPVPAAPAAAPAPEQPSSPAPTPPAESQPETSFSWSGSVESVRLRDPSGSLFGPGPVPPGTYSIYVRVDGSLRRVGSTTVRDGQHRALECNPLGCQ